VFRTAHAEGQVLNGGRSDISHAQGVVFWAKAAGNDGADKRHFLHRDVVRPLVLDKLKVLRVKT